MEFGYAGGLRHQLYRDARPDHRHHRGDGQREVVQICMILAAARPCARYSFGGRRGRAEYDLDALRKRIDLYAAKVEPVCGDDPL